MIHKSELNPMLSGLVTSAGNDFLQALRSKFKTNLLCLDNAWAPNRFKQTPLCPIG